MLRNAITQLSRKAAQPLAVSQTRSYFIVSPAKKPMKMWEGLFGIFFIGFGSMAPAAYILSHLEDYRGKAEEE